MQRIKGSYTQIIRRKWNEDTDSHQRKWKSLKNKNSGTEKFNNWNENFTTWALSKLKVVREKLDELEDKSIESMQSEEENTKR